VRFVPHSGFTMIDFISSLGTPGGAEFGGRTAFGARLAIGFSPCQSASLDP
jgi:hypothetical protein